MAAPGEKRNIIQSFRILKGNTRTAVMFEPMWSIPYGFYSFYLSLYMKSQGVTDVQIGFLISLNYIVGIFFALFSGVMVDKIGRKKTTLIFGLISWPGSALINFFATNFWMFALAQVVCSLAKISDTGWQLLLIEDADDDQRVSAFNMFGIIDIIAGFFTPIAGIIVANLGLVKAERGFLLLAVVSMGCMIVIRNLRFNETTMGKIALARSKAVSYWAVLKGSIAKMGQVATKGDRKLRIALMIVVLYNAYIPIGALSSLYFAPYLTDVIGLDPAIISNFGLINAAFMLVIFVFIIPYMSKFNKLFCLTVGFGIQCLSMISRTLIPHGNFGWSVFSVALFSVGYGFCRPFLDSLMAEASPDETRADIYAFKGILVSAVSALAGSLSGFLYQVSPLSIYLASCVILLSCILLIVYYFRSGRKAEELAMLKQNIDR